MKFLHENLKFTPIPILRKVYDNFILMDDKCRCLYKQLSNKIIRLQ